ncbi:MAG: tandem-95 repeat protein [Actinomycetales bacterium]|nr:tandem-95 repeat protein [Actinomycetales bacterium]
MLRLTRTRSSRPRALAALLSAVLVAAGISAVAAAPALAAAAPAFDCSAPRFFAQAGGSSSTQLNEGSYLSDGTSQWTPLGAQVTGANLYNALAFNPVDEYLYGITYGSAVGRLVRIDRAGNTTNLGQTNPALSTSVSLYDSGEFDAAGNYYVATGNAGGTGATTIYKLSGVAAATGTTGTRPTVSTISLTGQTSGMSYADFTYKAGYLWATHYGTGGNYFYRINIDPANGTVGLVARFSASGIIPAASYGSAFTMTNGNLAFIHTTAGATPAQMHQVSVTNPSSASPTFELVSSVAAPTNSYSDASNCRTALPASLALVKTGPSTVVAGGSITWDLAITNNGPGVSSGYALTDSLPAGLSNVTATSSTSACVVNGAQTSITCNGGTLAVGAVGHITVTATAPTTIGQIVNSARVVGNEDPDPDPPATADTQVAQSTSVDTPIAYTSPTSPTSGNTTSAQGGTVVRSGSTFTYTPPAGYSGYDSYSYTTASGTTTVYVTVAPTAAADTASTFQDTPVTVAQPTLLANDAGSGLTVTSVQSPVNGTVSLTPSGAVFTPAGGYTGPASFTYTVTDSSGLTATATVNVTVAATPPAPVAANDDLSTGSGVALTIVPGDLIGNDSGSGLTVSAIGPASSGTVASNGSGGWTYTPAPGFSGTATFPYTVTNGGGSSSATVTVTVRPDAVNDAASVAAGATTPIAVLANDLGSATTVTAAGPAAHGTVTFTASGVSYTPAAGYSGTDSFSYTLTADGGTDTATVSVTVGPDARDDSANALSGVATPIAVLGNDLGANLAVTGVGPAAHGTVAFTASGVTYTPSSSFSGTDTFSYTISGDGGTDSATVTVTVLPAAAPDSASTPAGQAVVIPVLANDRGAGLSVDAVTTAAAHGTVAIAGDGLSVTYTPVAGFSGTDTFVYRATDGSGTSTATVTVTVAPVAVDDSASTRSGTAVSIPVLTNDLGAGKTVTAVTQGARGAVTFTPAGVSYTPQSSFSGTDTFTYTLGADGGSTTATVTVTVAPDAVDDTAIALSGVVTPIAVRLNDLGANLTVTAVGAAGHGTVSFTPTGVTYTADASFSGTDTFSYTVTGDGGTDAATVTVTVMPVAVDDAATTAAGVAIDIPVLANDRGSALTIDAVGTAGHGTVAIVAGQVRYTPVAGFSGTDTFGYTAADGGGSGSSLATVTVTVAPDAVDDTASAAPGVALPIDVLANDVASGATVTAVTQGSNGTVAFTASGVTYTSTGAFSGTDTFTYTIVADGGSDTATVTVTVGPDARDDSASTDAGQAVTVPVLGNDLGSSLAVTAHGAASHGTVSHTASGVTYTPAAGFSGIDSFDYTISGDGGTDTATVTVTVGPVATADTASAVSGLVTLIPVLDNDLGTAKSVGAAGPAGHGTVTVTPGGVSYTPDPNFSGTDTFSYTLSADGGSDTATVTVTVAPDAIADTASTGAGITVSLDPRGNDHGTALAVTGVGAAGHGTVTFTATGVTYTPAAGFSGTDSFTYALSGDGGTDTATVTVTVSPAAVDDTASAVSGVASSIDVLANDLGAARTVTAASDGAQGTVTFTATGVTYTPAAGFSGTDSFEYTLTADGGTDTATVTVTVAPRAIDDSSSAVAGTPAAIDVLGNDRGTTTAVTGATDGAHGTVTFTPAGVVYTASASFSGTDTFTYTMAADGGSDTATVTVTVLPFAVDDTVTSVAGAPVTVPVLANDRGASLSVTGVGTPGHGTASFTATGVTYTPTAGFSGTDTVTYTATDGSATTTATITITVRPDAVDDTASTDAGSSATIAVLGNDLGTGRSVTAATDGAHGTVTFTATGVTYTPAPGFSGTDVFRYTLTADGGTDTADVTVTVAPVALADSASTTPGTTVAIPVLGNDLGLPRSVTGVTAPAHGTVTFTPSGVTYTPATGFTGVDTFVYTLSADGGSDTATVTVTVSPDAVDDSAAARSGVARTIDVLANDIGVSRVVTGVGSAAHGTVSFTATGVTYTAATTYSGTDSFTYSIGAAGGTDTATVTVTVSPDAIDDARSTPAETPISFDPRGNDRGVGIDVTGLGTGADAPANGVATFTAGQITYTPAAGFSGTEVFTYSIVGAGGVDTATVTILVTPTTARDALITPVDTAKTIDPRPNDRGTGLQVTAATAGAHGTVTFTASGVTYTPDAGFSGTDAFTYTVTDAGAQEAVGTVDVVVSPSSPDDTGSTTVGVPVEIDVLANDSGTGLGVTAVTVPAHGTAAVAPSGRVLYTPEPGFSGIDGFDYTAQDGASSTSGAHVTVFVAPDAVDDTANTHGADTVLLAPDANDSGTSLVVSDPVLLSGQGDVALEGNSVRYTPPSDFSGQAIIRYTVTDPDGLTDTAEIEVTVEPGAMPDDYLLPMNSSEDLAVLDNDHGWSLQIDSATVPTTGVAAPKVASGLVAYTTRPGFVGLDTFNYTIRDGNGMLASTAVKVRVLAVTLASTGATPWVLAAGAFAATLVGAIALIVARRKKTVGRHAA